MFLISIYFFLLTLFHTQSVVQSFLNPSREQGFHAAVTKVGRRSPSQLSAAASKATLTEETVWKIRFVLKGIETEKGKKVDEIFRIDANFLEEEGYEPPQGSIRQIPIETDRLKITKSYWQLSEDPKDRKDGLWVWGLFKEPLYPFLLLKLETDAIPLTDNEHDGDDSNDFIKPLQLFAQIDHRRDSERGVILDASDLKVRQVETIKADPFGAAKVDVYEEVSVGTLSIQPAVTIQK